MKLMGQDILKLLKTGLMIIFLALSLVGCSQIKQITAKSAALN